MSVRRIHILQLVVATSLLGLSLSVHPQSSWRQALQSLSQPDCHSVRVVGAVRVPSRFELQRPTRLRELLDLAGGLEAKVGKIIQVTHIGMGLVCGSTGANQNSKSGVSEDFDIADVMRGDDKANPLLKPGDVVLVHGPDVVYVLGTKVPQPLLLTEGMSLTRAVELTGGPAKNSKFVKVRLLRTVAGEESQLKFVLTLKDIKDRRSEDPLLRAYDILELSDEKGSFGHGTPWNGRIVWPELPLQVVK